MRLSDLPGNGVSLFGGREIWWFNLTKNVRQRIRPRRRYATGGISGTMVGSGAGLQPATAWQIASPWVLTRPATILLSGGLFYLLS